MELANLDDPARRAAGLACWSGPVEPRPISGGITNRNFMVEDAGERYFVRIGDDIPMHGVMRFNERAAARAAAEAGISPDVVHAEPGAIVSRFVEGRTWGPQDARDEANLRRAVDLIRRCHMDLPRHLRGPVLMFWVFHVVRNYAAVLREGASRHAALLSDLQTRADILAGAVGPVDIVFGHNDLLAANFIDDGTRLWLVDWDYAGFNSPLFDLANLATNNEYDPELERALLAAYFGRAPGPALMRRFRAMACASLLRETMWSMVSELHSTIEFDYAAYTDENLARFERAYTAFTRG